MKLDGTVFLFVHSNNGHFFRFQVSFRQFFRRPIDSIPFASFYDTNEMPFCFLLQNSILLFITF